MLLAIPLNLYKTESVIFMEKKKNNILENSFFTKLIYSSKSITLNVTNLINKKFKCIGNILNCHDNILNLEKLFQIEESILKNYNDFFCIRKKMVFSIRNSFFNGSFKIYEKIDKQTTRFVYCISGICETNNEIKIIYQLVCTPTL
jgi:hypothetical protein